MLLNRFKKGIADSFVIVDSLFPQKDPFAFRNAEINEYFRRVKNSNSYTMYPMQPGPGAPFSHVYGMEHEDFEVNKQGYLRYYPENKARLHFLRQNKEYAFQLAYSFFLGETYVLLPFYEKNRIPFVFVLYPGGLFGLNSKESDAMLRQLFTSPFFRAVIVTQQITKDYLISQKLCPEEQINYIYGGIVQFKKDDVQPKKYYKKDKKTLDICFVAAKYSEQGIDKGYDLFIETAKILCSQTDDVMFHVVGGFDETEIDITAIKDRIRFYGYKRPDFLVDFYSRMDIFLSPNRPFKLFGGNFDGFPLGIDAGYCGTALFVADELKMNHHFIEGVEIVIVSLNAKAIAKTIMHYYHNVKELYALSERGCIKTQAVFDINKQVSERIKVFSEHVNIQYNDREATKETTV